MMAGATIDALRVVAQGVNEVRAARPAMGVLAVFLPKRAELIRG